MKKILIIRFSALGDVAMTVPAIYALATQNPELDITVLSRTFCAPFFERLPQNVHFVGADFRGRHKGFAGLNRLIGDVELGKFDCVADLHGVLRTRWLSFVAHLLGKKVIRIDKGRAAKRALTRSKHKQLAPQKTSFERYADVLKKMGFDLEVRFDKIDFGDLCEKSKPANARWIGVAPFAKHRGKIYPHDKMADVLKRLSQEPNTTIFLFGAGEAEKATIDNWCATIPNTISAVGKQKIANELALMSQLDVMLTMDSANMHMASLVGVRVVSIWGATHPFAGFLGWNQAESDCVQIDLPCRPCSVFGNKPCMRGDYACLNEISPEMIVEKILQNES